jgi:hypothetical protein
VEPVRLAGADDMFAQPRKQLAEMCANVQMWAN